MDAVTGVFYVIGTNKCVMQYPDMFTVCQVYTEEVIYQFIVTDGYFFNTVKPDALYVLLVSVFAFELAQRG